MSELNSEIVIRSTFDRAKARKELERWFTNILPQGAEPELSELIAPTGAGLSSETLLFEATWTEGGERKPVSLVGRMAPQETDMPIFPKYDIEGQFRVQQLVADRSEVPVPRMRWLNKDPSVLGAPFFLMDRVDGRVPTDVPPYTTWGWLMDLTADERSQLEKATVQAIAGIHSIEVNEEDIEFLQFKLPGKTPLERHVQREREYYKWVTADGIRHPVLERAFQWIEDNWPHDRRELSISWGDSRIGNILYDGLKPAALLDWEVVAVGPRELDIGWLCFFHQWHQAIAEMVNNKGIPDFLRLKDVASIYERKTGIILQDLNWYFVYAALRLGTVMVRYYRRAIHFGQFGYPEDPDDMILHKEMLHRLLEGSMNPLT
jgi:aminoglycoside phosphotransferase (APT) family kinase protein